MQQPSPAPEWEVAEWLNAPGPIRLADLRGRVVFALAFQLLCPGCAMQALPQAQRVRAAFPEDQLAVLGLHSVFEHHEAQDRKAVLAAFLHENRIGFPVAMDAPDPAQPMPRTMQRYRMQGTPTLLLIDREGRLQLSRFGHLDDLRLGAAIASLVSASS